MAYVEQTWTNEPSTNSPLSAERLNHIEQGITAADVTKPGTPAANALAAKAPLASPAFTGTVTGVTAAMVGLPAVDNTADADKPVSTDQAAALATKAPLASPTFTGTVSGVTKAHVGLGSVDNTADSAKPVSTAQATALGLKANLASPTFTGTVGGVTAAMVGLGSVDNTADAAKPVSAPQQTALDLKANAASPAFTGTPTGLTKAHVGLANADNTSDVNKPVSNLQAAALGLKADAANPNFTGTVTGVTKAHVGLGSVDNTSDAGKPVSTAQAAALALKAPLASPTFTGTVAGVTKAHVGLGSVDNTADSAKPVSTAQAAAIALKADAASPAFTGTPTGLLKAHVGLGNVDNTADTAKPVSTPQATALALKADLASPTFTGTVAGITKAMVGLNNVDNTTDASKPVSTAQAAALALKANLASPTFTGTVSGVTKAHVGLGAVDNTADTDKPVSTLQATAIAAKAPLSHTHVVNDLSDATVIGKNIAKAVDAAAVREIIGSGSSEIVLGTTAGTAADAGAVATSLAAKAPLASPAFTGTVTGITKAMVGLNNVDDTTDAGKPVSTAQAAALALKAPLASPTFTGTVSGVTKTHVGLGSVDNTADSAKPVSTAQATALALKANLASPTFTGTVGGITKAMVGLGNVDNTTDLGKPISTATQTALDGKLSAAALADGYATKAEARLSVLELEFDPTKMAAAPGTQLVVPTHVSPAGGQTTHPSVLFIPESLGGYKYWMAHTPYASTSDAQEDPNIVASHDGITWVTPAGLTNPLDDQPGSPGAYNSDVDLKLGPDNTMYLFWRTYDVNATGAEERLNYRTSKDGVTWTAKVQFMVYSAATRRMLSPTFVFENGKWTMWAVDIVPTTHILVRLVSNSAIPEAGWSAPVTVPITGLLAGKEPWHVFIMKAGGKYFGILADADTGGLGGQGDLLFIQSATGTSFQASGNPIIAKNRPGVHDSIYRSTIVPGVENGVVGFRLWYCGWMESSTPDVWNLFRTFLKPGGSSDGGGSTRLRQTGFFTASTIAAGGASAPVITFPTPFAAVPHVNVVTDSGRINPAAASVTNLGFTFVMNNWTAAQAAGAKASWEAEER